MRSKAIDVLIEMGIPADSCGFRFILEALCLIENPSWNKCKLTALYYKIATTNNVSISKVERGIRTAFSCVFRNGNEEVVNKYLPTEIKTNGNLLYVLYYQLTKEV